MKKKQKTQLPRTLADSIPYARVYGNGIFELKPGQYSKTYRHEDANFRTKGPVEQAQMAQEWGEFLGGFAPDVTVQETLYNRSVDMLDFQNQIMIGMQPDGLNQYRGEYNDMLTDKLAVAKNNIRTDRYFSVSLPAADIKEAVDRFQQIDNMVNDNMAHITKKACVPMTATERLDLLNSIYHPDDTLPLCRTKVIDGHEVESFSLEKCRAQGITTKDVIHPDSLTFRARDFDMGPLVCRSYCITDYPSWLKASLFTDLANLPCNMLVSAYYNTIAQEDAIRIVKNKRLNISSLIYDNQKKAARKGTDASLISPELQDSKNESDELMDIISKENGRLFTINIVVTLFAADRNALESCDKALKAKANQSLATIRPVGNQQEAAFNSSLPLAHNELSIQRLAPTDTVAAVIPFNAMDVSQRGGIYYGINAKSRNLILYDRLSGTNPNGVILGMPGAGKSFTAKEEMVFAVLATMDDIYVIDPQGEYARIAESLGGSVVKLVNGSNIHINPFDLNIRNTTEEKDPVKVKVDFIESIIEMMIGGRFGLGPTAKSLIDRCATAIYEPYIRHLDEAGLDIDTEAAPTFLDFYNELIGQATGEAQNMALSLERYVKGARDVFSYRTNVEINNRFTVFDVTEIGAGLEEVGLYITYDHIWNRMIQNFYAGKVTRIYCDEFHRLMRTKSSSAYMASVWKMARKWNGIPTAITQNVEDMLKNEDARTIINNSFFKVLLGQSPINKSELSSPKLFDLSPEEQKYISTSKPGMGLVIIGNDVLPRDDDFPKDTELYRLLSTKPNEFAV